MLHYLYERLLERQISRGSLPKCLAIILSSSDLDKEGLKLIRDLCNWSESLGLSSLIFSINEDTPETREKIVMLLRDAPADICLHTEDGLKSIGAGGSFRIIVSLGFGGKREVTEAFRKLLKDVENGRLNPEDIDEKSIEKNLRFGEKPDLVIRAGGKHLSDFMIWQAAYSELYFTEIRWSSLRKIDFLRAIRDCRNRKRRFGR